MRLSDQDWHVEPTFNTVQPTVLVTRDPVSGEVVPLRILASNPAYMALYLTSQELGLGDTPPAFGAPTTAICSTRAWYYEVVDPLTLTPEMDRRLLTIADVRGFQENDDQPLEPLAQVRRNILSGTYDTIFVPSSSQPEVELRWATWLIHGGW